MIFLFYLSDTSQEFLFKINGGQIKFMRLVY